MDELKTVEQIRRQDREVPLLLITRNSSEARVIAALRAGVTDYFKWPVSYEELIASVNRNLSYHKRSLSETGIDQPMIGDSAQMQEIKAYLLKVAATDSTVFITGETGTGKELAAELIHRNSSRHKKPFVCINCAALPESLIESEMFGYERGAFTGAIASKRGKFELAVGGTVFLDEIGDMSLYAQAKILRTIERKEVYRLGGNGRIPVDVRVTAATNQDPERLVAEGKFRKDLYYRLNVARVNLPLGIGIPDPLRLAGQCSGAEKRLRGYLYQPSLPKDRLHGPAKPFPDETQRDGRAYKKREGSDAVCPLCHKLEQEQSRPEAPLVQDDSLPEDSEVPHKYLK
jgi:DNA-binding NtrC family response regulator